jgi:hypothetical protein
MEVQGTSNIIGHRSSRNIEVQGILKLKGYWKVKDKGQRILGGQKTFEGQGTRFESISRGHILRITHHSRCGAFGSLVRQKIFRKWYQADTPARLTALRAAGSEDGFAYLIITLSLSAS